jgi:hypothetical protein
MKHYWLALITLFSAASAMERHAPQTKLIVHNAILTQVNDTTISVFDVKKKLDVAFHKNYPQLAESAEARLQFYNMSWKNALLELVDQQLIIADAKDKEIKLSDGEVREEMENRFGPNITLTLSKIGLTFDEAFKMVKDDMIVQRMNWWFVHAKATTQITPQAIRQAYWNYTQENPPAWELSYQIVSIRGPEASEIADKAYALLERSSLPPDALKEKLLAIDASISVSTTYQAKDTDLSTMHRDTLRSIEQGHYSQPTLQQSRVEKGQIARIFYLNEAVFHEAPPFDAMAPRLREELLQVATMNQGAAYAEKLHKKYGVDPNRLIPADLHPFSLE